ncbi:MAG TPA: methylated-DNA--[protein]-cysteine S-methyltransferase [Humisphaera sp.]|jgi:methylated-DNA-[protein]-cysteine S-methyltransferase|nr:methylated-DNA--[protein]-cysteine S-methyltransferase [Humisphaera sp.]
MSSAHYHIFKTALGPCGIAWTQRDARSRPLVTHFQLPEASAGMTESRILGKSGASKSDSPPVAIVEIVERVCRHLAGDIQDFNDIELDLEESPPFARLVYKAARKIPVGQTRTYGQIAKAAGSPAAARAVGQALGQNPIALIVPCHRVLAAGGKTGGFSAHGGCATKARMLELEGANVTMFA